ncbi:PhzF family phenazine biosynthesis protein [Kribbella sp. NPDC051952]|uniref:PhzF family phenazine biosynthesis protein n=1 Tax=Kribbella sp. NPDC051952 TaxID=3154851 RepID=UPI003440E447
MEPDLSRIPTAMIGAVGPYPDGCDHAFELRTFAPGASGPDDPICCSMNASVAQWLISTGIAPDTYQVSQGQRLGRAGTVHIRTDPNGHNLGWRNHNHPDPRDSQVSRRSLPVPTSSAPSRVATVAAVHGWSQEGAQNWTLFGP